MRAISAFVGWLGRRAFLYLVIVAALLAGAFVVPWIKTEWSGPARHLDRAARLETVAQQLEVERRAAQQKLNASALVARQASLQQVDAALGEALQAKKRAEGRRRSGMQKAQSLAMADADALIADGRTELEIRAYDGQIAVLMTAREQLVRQQTIEGLKRQLVALSAQLGTMEAQARAAEMACRQASADVAAFEKRWVVRLTLRYYDRARYRQLQAAQRDRCANAARTNQLYQAQAATVREVATRQVQAERAYAAGKSWAMSQIGGVTAAIDQRVAAERTSAEGSLRAKFALWAKEIRLSSVLKQAVFVLITIIVTPYLIRLFCYFVLAPMAMRRPSIRLQVPGGISGSIPDAPRSTTSVGIRLRAGEELLVRQDYLQTTSHVGEKGTQWFLDWRHPITSLATGLTFLTRIRGSEEVTTVSAVHDPFAEVAVLVLPEGSGCVLKPRALAAVVQPMGQPLRVKSHWRLFSLNAWLTLQLRYMVFHGPAQLVIKGGRGVRIERAERGRIFSQDQLVGFSADLAYSVTRTETFWPYFLGREQLLKDRVEAGEGMLIVEEAPMAGRRRGEARHGIEGMIDAGMKMFGM